MKTYVSISDNEGNHIFDDFPDHLHDKINTNNGQGDKISEIDKIGKIRIAYRPYKDRLICVVSEESRHIKRRKFFLEHVSIVLSIVSGYVNNIRDERQKYADKNEEFIHNIVSLNSYSIQDLFALIPQTTLTKNINSQEEIIDKIVEKNIRQTTTTLLNLIKYTLASKVEFSVFEQTHDNYVAVKKQSFPIRDVFISVLQIFMKDFKKKGIDLHLDATDRSLDIDYDSMLVTLYYIFDNAVKYCCPRTKLKIIFKDYQDKFEVHIEMISIRIEENEKDKLFRRRFRSEIAKKMNAAGQGIGMYRIMKTLKINNATLEVAPRFNGYTITSASIKYEANKFTMTFLDQTKWNI